MATVQCLAMTMMQYLVMAMVQYNGYGSVSSDDCNVRKKVQSWNQKHIAWYAFENDQRNRTLNHNSWKLKNACGSFRDILVLMV